MQPRYRRLCCSMISLPCDTFQVLLIVKTRLKILTYDSSFTNGLIKVYERLYQINLIWKYLRCEYIAGPFAGSKTIPISNNQQRDDRNSSMIGFTSEGGVAGFKRRPDAYVRSSNSSDVGVRTTLSNRRTRCGGLCGDSRWRGSIKVRATGSGVFFLCRSLGLESFGKRQQASRRALAQWHSLCERHGASRR